MARVAVVGVSVAKPQSHRAAELAFEVNILSAMRFDFAFGYPCRAADIGTPRADQFLRLKFPFLQLVLLAVLHASEVRILALIAHVVSAFVHCELLQLVVKWVLDVFESWVLIKTLMLSS